MQETLSARNQELNATTQKQRAIYLARQGHNTSRLAPQQVDFDFSTDSWGLLNLPYMITRMDALRLRAQGHALDRQEVMAQRFPFRHFIATPRGRDAEELLFSVLAEPQSKVVQNILFHTARGHQLKSGLVPVEIPHAEALTNNTFPFKGNLDLDKLRQILNTETVGLIFIEALSNGVGGHPVSVENVRAVYALAQEYQVPVYIDATRAVENCALVREYEPEFTDWELADILREFLSYCDGITASLVKDYGLTYGGLLATNSDEVYARAQARALKSEFLLTEDQQAPLTQALADWDYVETQVQARIRQTRRLHAVLHASGLPVRHPPGGHAVILDVSLLNDTALDAAGMLAALYLHTGMRGTQHWGGLALEYQRPLWIRLAVPLGCSTPDKLVSVLKSADLNSLSLRRV